jgi:crotonobetainyl-CoA:carnitine CoA-transferase CaiB-like acyl-CoA transferase
MLCRGSSAYPLAGLRVVEIGSTVGVAFCTRLLAALGADVIVVEPPEGHALRRLEIVQPRQITGFVSPHALYLLAGKRTVTLDLTDGHDRQCLRELLSEADVVVHDLQPAVLAGLGFREDRLSYEFPRLIETSITPFGRTGPYADWRGGEIIEYALGGLMYISGPYYRPPVAHAAHQSGYRGGIYAAAATLIAVAERWRSDVGQQVDVALCECLPIELRTAVDEYITRGLIRRREPIDGPGVPEQGVMACRDGFVTVVVGGHFDWSSFARFMDIPELAEPRFQTAAGRVAHAPEMNALMRPRLLERTTEEWFELAQLWRFIWGPVRNLAQVLSCPHLAARDAWDTVDHPDLGPIRMPRIPFRMSESILRPPTAAPEQAPRGAAVHWLPRPVTDASPGPGWSGDTRGDIRPLAGLRVIDLGNWVTIPYLCRVLADFGAEVIKVESPRHLTVGRLRHGTGHGFSEMHRNKRSVTIELDRPEGVALFMRLVATADVLVENFAPRVMANLGLTYDRLRAVNPRLIYLSSTGFGQSGPYRDYGAFGSTLESMIGLASLTGFPDDPPTRCGLTYIDYPAAMMGCVALIAALAYRRRTGRGQYIDLSQYETGVSMMGGELVGYQLTKELPPRRGNRSRDHAPQGVYRCAGLDNWLAIAITTDAQFVTLCRLMGREDLAADPRYATTSGRQRYHDEIDVAITAWARAQDHIAAMYLLQEHGIPAAAVLNPKELLLDAQSLARGYFRPSPPQGMELPPETPLVTAGIPFRLSRTPGGIVRWVPAIGEDNETIFKGLLGLSDADYDRLVAAGVITLTDRIDLPPEDESIAEVPREVLKELGRISAWDDGHEMVIATAYGGEPAFNRSP